jgi:hypothetical protein
MVHSGRAVFPVAFVIPAKEAVSHFVIPAKPRERGREPGSRSPRYDTIFWIPDLALIGGARLE